MRAVCALHAVRTAVPELLDHAEALARENERLRAALTKIRAHDNIDDQCERWEDCISEIAAEARRALGDK